MNVMHETSENPPAKTQLVRSAASAAASFCLAVWIFAIQSSFLPYFEPLFSQTLVWRIAFYGFFTIAVAAALTTLSLDANLRRTMWPVLLFCAATIALCLIHPITGVAKNLIVAVVMIACLATLAPLVGQRLVELLCASVTALSAAICLSEMFFAIGFSNTLGRSAGLFVNPNIAAASILLGAVVSFRSVPGRYQSAFLVLIAGGIVATLSRNVLLVGLIVLLFSLLRNFRSVVCSVRSLGWINFAGVACLMIAIVAAAATNDRFSRAAANSLSIFSPKTIDSIGNSFSKYLGSSSSRPDSVGVPAAYESPASQQTQDVRPQPVKPDDDLPMRTASENLATERGQALGQTDSAAFRVELLQRALTALRTNPLRGIGIEAAHQLAPHNSYLLFTLAFGWLGLVIPVALVLLVVNFASPSRDLALPLSLAGAMFFTHDILLPALVVPIAIGVAGSRNQLTTLGDHRSKIVLQAYALLFPVFFVIAFVTVLTNDQARTIFDQTLTGATAWPTVAIGQMHPQYSGIVRPKFPGSAGEFSMLESNTEIASSTSPRSDVVQLGHGRFAQTERDLVYFTASDNSNPILNGRTYTVTFPVSFHPLLFIVLLLLCVWLAVVMRIVRRHKHLGLSPCAA